MLLGCPGIDQWHVSVPRSSRIPTLLGLGVVAACGLGFGAWAATAPLDGAVVTSGTFVAAGQNKQIQHLEGGIVSEVDVKEGDLVEAGQVLLRLDPTTAVAKLRMLVLRKDRLITAQARLEAELAGKETFSLPATADVDVKDPEVQMIIKRQELELTARRNKLQAEIAVLHKEIAGLKESIAGYNAQISATQQRLDLFGEELKAKNALLQRDLIRKTEVYAVQRDEAALNGELGELVGRVADSRQQVARAEQQIASIQSTATQKSVEELRQTESDLDDVTEQIRSAKDVVERTDVKAPVRGIVVKLNQHTRGGVVAAGSTILELLPVNDELIIEGRISPNQVVHVKEGQPATVRLSALNQRVTPMIDGHVSYLSADTISDRPSMMTETPETIDRGSFIVRVKLDKSDVLAKIPDFKPTPGMPADLYIRTGKRTFFDYIMEPVMDSFSRAFREK
ncbi:HlyD family type I secretion periplasmic adaptor subunit [Hyphomicrobium sp.]|jgi:HlyD family secretion protein|uniref:HlyD family type I secretion periplasmic adaptor subunit n=1 Tax=Hyphomicrobium sp. TaxID=82 RepID=UPI002C091913|nr:HlyD family type I secretion periplasmic adaptor subunit [Hyphomicrobium sp.]HVZ03944.1 HlyD family type I secretion periplasmic adaptor subunit [Hyphomicrobium sp.]